MKDILIVSHFSFIPGEVGNDRFVYIAERLVKDNKVEIITSGFSHNTKTIRKLESNIKLPYRLTLINEPGYYKNISLKRIYSHYFMGKELKKYLKKRKIPDLIYCAVPSLDVAYIMAKYAKKNKVRFIIDIQDIWPEAFEMVFNIPFISKIIFYPMKKKADFIYRNANAIIAVSETYLNRATSVNKKYSNAYSIFLGTELKKFDFLKQKYKIKRNKHEIWIAYVGTLGHSYDIQCVINSLKILRERGINNIKFIIMGDGPLKDKFEKYAIKNKVNCDFTGRLPYEKMVAILSECDIAVNPITKGAAQSIINKVGDYAAAGLPVINTQECIEYKKLVEKYNIGFNVENSNDKELANRIMELAKNKNIRQIMGNNNRKLAEEKFDREITYSKIISLLLDEG